MNDNLVMHNHHEMFNNIDNEVKLHCEIKIRIIVMCF